MIISMKIKNISTSKKEIIPLKNEKTLELDEKFDWDWIFDREWLRTKK